MSGRQGKYDIELASGDVSVGYMLDASVEEHSVDFAESEPTDQSSVVQGGNAAGLYGWRDQRNMPGVAISDFRGGQGQKVLDRADSAANAFRSGRHLNCEVEGEVSLAQGFVTVLCPGLTNVVFEAGGTIWAGFEPDAEEELDPKSVRYLVRGQTTLIDPIDGGSFAPVGMTLDDDLDLEVGDHLYLPASREVVRVQAVDPDLVVERAAAIFDNQDGTSVAQAHEAGDAVYLYGWRALGFTPVGTTPDEHVPTQEVRSFAFDGEYLYAAFSETTAGAWYSTIWRYQYGDTDYAMELFINDVAGVENLCYGLGWLYYASDSVVGYVRQNALNTAPELAQLSLNRVVGETWVDDHFENDERATMAPTVRSVGLTMSGTWCYWLTTSGRNSWLYRTQAPSSFELVYPFQKGFVATCIEQAYGNVYVGGYFTQKGGAGDGVDSYKGGVYIFFGDTAERVVTLDEVEEGLDNRIKGLAAVGELITITTNTSLYHYSVRSGGWWHVGSLPPRDYDANIVPIDLSAWMWDMTFPFTGLPQASPNVWARSGTSDRMPTASNENDVDGQAFFEVHGDNCKYMRYHYEGASTGDNMLAALTLPRTTKGSIHRRAFEVSLCNNKREARFRLVGQQKNDVWKFAMLIGKYHPKRDDPAWSFTEAGWYDSRDPYTIYFQLTARGAFMWATAENSDLRLEGPDMVPATKLKKGTGGNSFWWSGGIPLGNAIVYDKKDKRWIKDTDADVSRTVNFRACVAEMSFTDDDLSPRRYVMNPSEQAGAAAELDGEVVIPLRGDEENPSELCFTRVGETYTGQNAMLTTSDSYQNMGTAMKFYRRFEVSLPQLLEGQFLWGQASIDDQPQEASDAEEDVLVVAGDGIAGSEARGSTLLQKVINQGGTKSHVTLRFFDAEHLREDRDRLKVNSIATRFMPASSPLKLQYVFDCIDHVDCRDGSKWDVSADDAVNFVKRLKKSGAVVLVTTDEGVWSCIVDAYKFVPSVKDEEAVSVKQGALTVVLRVLDE